MKIKELLLGGFGLDEIIIFTGASTSCGCCKEHLEKIVDDHEIEMHENNLLR